MELFPREIIVEPFPDPETTSADIVAENIEALKALFPEAFTNGRIDFDVLKGLLARRWTSARRNMG